MRVRVAVGGVLIGVGIVTGAGAAHAEYAPSCPADGLGTADCPYIDRTLDDPGFDVSGPIGGMIVLGLLIGGGVTLYKVSVAKDMARRAGMDEHDAMRTTLLSEDGLAATYVASSLRGSQGRGGYDPTPPPPTVERRLAELKRLHDKGLITPEEYETRRTRILDEV